MKSRNKESEEEGDLELNVKIISKRQEEYQRAYTDKRLG